jgi:hypothetical protein
MDAATASLLGVLIGGFLGVIGGVITTLLQGRAEANRYERAARDRRDQAVRSAIADFARQGRSAIHSIMWTASQVRFFETDPEIAAQFAAYDASMRGVLDDLLGAHVVLGTLDRASHEKLGSIVQEIYAADWDLAEAGALQRRGDESWFSKSRDGYNKASATLSRLGEEVWWEPAPAGSGRLEAAGRSLLG